MMSEQELRRSLDNYCLPHRLIPMKSKPENRLESLFNKGYGYMILDDFAVSGRAFNDHMIVGRNFLILKDHGVIMYSEIISMIFYKGSPAQQANDPGGSVPANWVIRYRDCTNSNEEDKTVIYLDVNHSSILFPPNDPEMKSILKNCKGLFEKSSVKQDVLLERVRREHLEFARYIRSRGIKVDDYIVKKSETEKWMPTYLNYKPYYLE